MDIAYEIDAIGKQQTVKPANGYHVFHNKPVFPGDDVSAILHINDHSPITLSHGLMDSIMQDGETAVTVTVVGILKHRAPSTFYVETIGNKIYTPREGDQVVGIVEDKGGEFYKVNIFSSSSALLGRLAFEGATKRNKPELHKGDVVYARVTLSHKDIDCELSCISSSGSKKEWSSGETMYGILAEGVLIRVSLSTARALLLPDCVVLNALGRFYSYEVTVGINGAVWIKAGDPSTCIIIRNAIINSAELSDVQCEAMVELLAAKKKCRA